MENFSDIVYTSNHELATMTSSELLDLEKQTIITRDSVREAIKNRVDNVATIKLLPYPDRDFVRRGFFIVNYCERLLSRIGDSI